MHCHQKRNQIRDAAKASSVSIRRISLSLTWLKLNFNKDENLNKNSKVHTHRRTHHLFNFLLSQFKKFMLEITWGVGRGVFTSKVPSFSVLFHSAIVPNKERWRTICLSQLYKYLKSLLRDSYFIAHEYSKKAEDRFLR